MVSGTEKLLASDSVDDQNLALKAVVDFQNTLLNASVLKLVGAKKHADLSSLDLAALAVNPANEKTLVILVQSEELAISERLTALLAVGNTRKTYKRASDMFAKLYTSADDGNKPTLMNAAMESEQGIGFLLDLVGKKVIATDTLDLAVKKKMVDVQVRHPLRKTLMESVNAGLGAKKAAAHKKIASVAKAIEAGTLKGNAQTGMGVAQMCAQCHQIENKMNDLAPALGGYKDRDPEHLLTAIVAPNEAIEGGYRLYRLVRKNGQIIEGYMYLSDDNGTLVAKAGGHKIFTPKEQIKSEKFMNGQS